jgi:hypothetical protein
MAKRSRSKARCSLDFESFAAEFEVLLTDDPAAEFVKGNHIYGRCGQFKSSIDEGLFNGGSHGVDLSRVKIEGFGKVGEFIAAQFSM